MGNQSPEERDQLHRSVKKHKRDERKQSPEEAIPLMDNIPHSTVNIWNNGSFANVLKGHIHKPQIYTKEGEEDMLDDLGLTDI